MPRFAFMGILANSIVPGNYDPASFDTQLANPILVFCLRRELLLKVGEAVIRLHHFIECAGVTDGEAVIQKEIHAASRCSNSTASSISAFGTSYQRLTSSNESDTFAALARTSVGTPCFKTLGRPKFRVGSSTTNRLVVVGRHRSSVCRASNCSSFRNGVMISTNIC